MGVKICKEIMNLEEEEEADSTNTTKVDPINAKTTNTSSSNADTTKIGLTTKPATKNVKSPLKRGQDKNTESNQNKRRKVESKEIKSNEEKEQTGINETNICSDNGSILWTPELATSFEKLKLISPRLVAGSVPLEQVVRHTGLQGDLVRAWQDSLAQFIPRAA